jgi:hypothetical protein
MLVSWAPGYLRNRPHSSSMWRTGICTATAAILFLLPLCAFGQSYGVQILGSVHLGTGGSGPSGFISCTLPYSECFDQAIAVPAGALQSGAFLQSVSQSYSVNNGAPLNFNLPPYGTGSLTWSATATLGKLQAQILLNGASSALEDLDGRNFETNLEWYFSRFRRTNLANQLDVNKVRMRR